jgi:transketolase
VPEGYAPGAPHVLRRGDDLLILSTGMVVRECSLAAERLAQDHSLSVGVADVHTVKPSDASYVAELARGAGAVMTVEEHNVDGGLGSLVADALAAHRA